MLPADTARLHRRLDAIRRRLVAQRLLDVLAAGLLGAAAVVLVGGTLLFLRGVPPWQVWRTLTLRQMAAALPVFVGVVTAAGLVSREAAAAFIDRLAGTHDRFHTALAFASHADGARTPLEDLSLAECARYIEDFPVRRWLPLRPPRALAFLAVPLVSLGLLCWHASLGIGHPPRDPALDAAVAGRADALQKIADRLHPADDKTPRPDLDKVADAMKRSAERLKQAAHADDPEKLRTALKELSSLEAMLAAMRDAAREPKLNPAELNALAAALASNAGSKAAADALQKGDLEQAAGEMEKLLDQMKQAGDPAQTLQQLARSMQEQAAKLTDQEKSEVARQMEQAAQATQSGEQQLGEQALQRLADLLRKAGRDGRGGRLQASGGAPGQPMTPQQMQDLLNSLENMKDGLQQPGGDDGKNPGSPQDGPGQGQSLALVESFTKNGGADSKAGQPSGVPGSEHDAGHPDKIFTDTPADPPKAGQAHRIEGILGDGSALQELVHSASGPAKASRRYRDLYEAVAPGAQNSVEQENIPLGSRHFVRRYFENIRPQN